jgi:hypothetical protein
MTKEEAIQAMKDGKRVAHSHFTKKEWMKLELDSSNYEFEDGIICEREAFWVTRDCPSWEYNWRVV